VTLWHGVAVATGRLAVGCRLAEGRPATTEGGMPEPGWKAALREPHALGWIGLMVAVILIGFGSLYFGGNGSSGSAQPPTSQAAK
jgi:hypothetical protein